MLTRFSRRKGKFSLLASSDEAGSSLRSRRRHVGRCSEGDERLSSAKKQQVSPLCKQRGWALVRKSARRVRSHALFREVTQNTILRIAKCSVETFSKKASKKQNRRGVAIENFGKLAGCRMAWPVLLRLSSTRNRHRNRRGFPEHSTLKMLQLQ